MKRHLTFKQAFVREEISVRKEVEQVTVDVEDKIRREELDLISKMLTLSMKPRHCNDGLLFEVRPNLAYKPRLIQQQQLVSYTTTNALQLLSNAGETSLNTAFFVG